MVLVSSYLLLDGVWLVADWVPDSAY